ncbi:klarsicht protein-like [Hetaerina americana]|uniref:klarsicht protein-like n=1 Tax=Hetaerina americana TaxID=62018 RepID=UPI003A7F2C62
MEATSSEALDHSIPDSPSFSSMVPTLLPEKSLIMRESAYLERMERPINCAYVVVRRIDTDSEAEMKENGVGGAEEDELGDKLDGAANVASMEMVEMGSGTPNGDLDETEGEEEDEEWVYSHVSTGKSHPPEERDLKSRKSLLYENSPETIERDRQQHERDGGRVNGRRVFESLKLNSSASDIGAKGKYARIRQWLKKGGPAGEESAESQEEQAPRRYPIDSCDASGEYTSSGESSEAESQSSGDLDGSIATCRKSSTVTDAALTDHKVSPLVIQDLGISSLSLSPTDGDVTPVADGRGFPGSTGSISLSPSGKMVLRVKRRKSKTSNHHQRSPKSEQKRRPWSICVSGHGHLVTMTSPGIHPLPTTPHSTSPTPNSPNRAKIHSTLRSTSEQAIHCLAYSSSSCSTGVDDVGSNMGRMGMGSGEVTPMRGSMDGDGVGSGAGSASTGSSRRKKIRTRRRTLGQKSESGNSDNLLGEMGMALMHRRGSRSSSKGLSPCSKGSSCQSTGSDLSSSNMVPDESKDEVDGYDEVVGLCKEGWRMSSSMTEVPLPPDDEDGEEEEKLGSLQTEETSSYSEQAWDNYQVCLSEGGEYTSDDDRTTKEQLLKNLMEFGDDYRQHFDSQSDGGSSLARQPPTPCSTLDSFPGDGQHSLPRSHSPTPPSPGSSSRTGSGRRKRQAATGLVGSSRPRPPFGDVPQSSMLPPNFLLSTQGPQSLSPMVNLVDGMCNMNPVTALDSDSDLEDVNHFLQESLAQVMYTESVMGKALSRGLSPLTNPGKFPPPADYAEMAATCRENIKCLRAFLETVGGNTGGTMLPPRDFWVIKDLVHRWEMLESRVEECHQARLLRQEIAAMRDAMVAPTVGRIRNGRVEDLQNRKELERRIQEVKAEITAIFALKSEILDVNVSVNRFLTGTAQPIQCPSVTTTGAQGSTSVNGQEATPAPEDSGRHNDYAFLKDEVAEMYRDWDESFGRLNADLAALQRVSRTWAELDEGLSSLGSDLSSDRSTLNNLSTAVAAARVSSPDNEELSPTDPPLAKATQTPALLAASVQELARVLSEEKAAAKVSGPRGDKEEEEEEDLSHGFLEEDHNGDVHVSFGLATDPLGSLSDSGISDSGSEGRGMCERGRRLAALRKLARTLAATLGPNSPPLVALKQRLDDFQKELRSLQRTCRELVFCTAMLCSANQARNGNPEDVVNGTSSRSSFSNQADANATFAVDDQMNGVSCYQLDKEALERVSMMLPEGGISEGEMAKLKKLRSSGGGGGGGGGGGDDNPFGKKKGRGGKGRRHWLWRAMCLAMPFQLALVLLLYAAYFLEPHCCSAINNLSFSLTPQLHYIRGPPPI